MIMTYLFVLMMATFLGFEVISKVPATLHTPLMSGSNAISGITVVAAITSASFLNAPIITIIFGSLAVAFAAINVIGGFLVTDRMLAMFKKK